MVIASEMGSVFEMIAHVLSPIYEWLPLRSMQAFVIGKESRTEQLLMNN